MPALTASSGRPPSLPEVERAKPAEAHNNPRDTPCKSNGTTRAGRCTDASPARQARINSPEQSLKHRCQAGPGRLNRPAVLGQCPHVYVGWAALSFDPAGRTVTRSHCCLRLTRAHPCLGGSAAAIACSTRRGSSPLERHASGLKHRCCDCPRSGSAGPFIGGCRAHEIS